MDKHRQEIAANLDKYLIGLDEEFAFKCRGCGKCCKQREDIILNTRDLFNIAKKLNIPTKQIISDYCHHYIGGDSRIPVVLIKPRGVNKACPLLNGDCCRVHDVKPVVCALFPLGRLAVTEKREDLSLDAGIHYILQPPNCGSVRRKQTVRKWLERYNIPLEDEFYLKWHTAIMSLSKDIKYFEENKVTPKTLNMVWEAIFSSLYLSYDIHEEFLPQFIYNVDKLIATVAKSKSMYRVMHNKKGE